MFYSKENQRGVALYFALFVTALILGIALGLNTLLVDQLKGLRGAGYSAIALEAADAGIEKIFYDDQKGINVLSECPVSSPCTATLSNGASYSVAATSPGAGCQAATYCATSQGSYQQALRTLKIAR